jgi:DNA-binding PadR family transcriptional regulator
MTSFADRLFAHGFQRMSGRRRHGYGGHFDPRAFWGGTWRGMGFGPGGRRSRARRGDVRAATLLLLEEDARNGYQLMEEIERRSGGAWRPSPGSIYPALAQLEDEGLIRADESGGRRVFGLTEEGRAYVAENREALGSPWDEAGDDVPSDFADLRAHVAQLAMATMQVAQSGDEKLVAEAKDVLADARKSLNRLLAESG